MMLTPTTTFADCPQLDVICVPGGMGTDDMVNDEEMLAFLRKQAEGANYVTSVCTGSLVLGAAGLLKGYRAATHWSAMEYPSAFGATPTKTRVCTDRNRVTGGGVTAGIDFALTLVSMLRDRKTAEAIQLRLEYNPAPPFNAGSPDTAPAGGSRPHQRADRTKPVAAQRRHRACGGAADRDRELGQARKYTGFARAFGDQSGPAKPPAPLTMHPISMRPVSVWGLLSAPCGTARNLDA